MRLIIIFFCLFSLNSNGQFVGINDPNPVFGNNRQNVRPDASTNSAALDQIPVGNRLVCAPAILGGPTIAGGSYWYKTDIPTSGNTQVSGYVAAGFPYIVPDCNMSFVTISNPNPIGYINVRSQANETSAQVTINGNPARVINGQKFALVSTSFTQNGNYRWYQIYLTQNCSQSIGWIVGYSLPSGNNWVSINNSTSNSLNTPNITGISNITNNSATVSVTNQINYYYKTYSIFLNGNSHQDIDATGSSTSSQLNVTGLNAATSYSITVAEKNNTGCTSSQSSSSSFNTTGSGGCSYTISPTSNTVSSSGGTGFLINVSTGSGCTWTASASGFSWITITNGSSGTGNGTCTYSVSVNTSTNSRSGTITIAGQSFTITQDGTSGGCNYSITPANNTNVPTTGGTGYTINVSTNTSCTWTASASGFSWISITNGSSGSGNGTCTYSVSVNTGTNSRTGTITIAGQSFTVTQAGASGCNSPTINANPSNANVATGGSANFTVVVSGGTTPYGYQWQLSNNGGTSWTNITTGGTNPAYANWNTATLTLSGIAAANNNYRYRCIVSSGTPCTGSIATSNAAILTVSSVSPGTITINYTGENTFIPPWQRQNDDYDGQVTVNRSNQNASWHLEVDVLSRTGVFERAIIYPSTSLNTQVFNTANNSAANNQLKQYSVEGKIMRYYAVLENTNPLLAVRVEGSLNENDGKTNIIEKKWDRKNFVYFNTKTDIDVLRLPLIWSRNFPKFVKFSRVGRTSAMLGSSFPPNVTIPITINNGLNLFSYSGVNGYLEIKSSNSNIETNELLPGDFMYEIFGSNGIVIDYGFFDLTKIGKISNQSSKKILVMVGGIFNTMEISADGLKKPEVFSTESDLSYSFIEYCTKFCTSGYSSWYIAQGNCNFIRRNGYDIGIALEKIKLINDKENITETEEINLLCHSKGGLDVRSMLTSQNDPYDYLKPPFNLNESSLSGLIKKVVFVGSPHRGARLADYLGVLSNWLNIPAAVDLMKIGSNTIDILNSNSVQHPLNIKYLNITGYRLPNILTDDIVKVSESANPTLGNVDLKQLFQDDSRFVVIGIAAPYHYEIHKNKYLNYNDEPISAYYNCTNQFSTLNKIKLFLDNPLSIQSCEKIPFSWFNTFVSGSVNPGVSLSLINQTKNKRILLGNTDEKGFLGFNLITTTDFTDTIEFKASGYETLKLPFSIFIQKGNKIPLFKDQSATNKIKYPSVSFIDSNLITQKSLIKLKITALNASQILINRKTSSSLYDPLTTINDIATIPLDSGMNIIRIRFIGFDTVDIEKKIYYFPSNLIDSVTTSFNLVVDESGIGSHLFINDQYHNIVSQSVQSLKLMKGYNEIKFTKLGYQDTIFRIETDTLINLSLVLQNYSSDSDTILIDFNNKLNPQYWKSIAIKNLSQSTNRRISLKQVNNYNNQLGLKLVSRKFIYHNLNTTISSVFRTAITLDQSITPNRDSIYYLIKKGLRYRKVEANRQGISEYDPEVQKVAFDSLVFEPGETLAEFYIAKKQVPIFKSPEIVLSSGDEMKFNINQFVVDPDSIFLDMSSFVQPQFDPNFSVVLKNNHLNITAKRGFIGEKQFTITSTHDFTTVSKTFKVKINVPDIGVNTPRVYPNPTNGQLNVEYIIKDKVSGDIQIFNQLGQPVKSFKRVYDAPGYYTQAINVSELSAGVYIIKFNGEKSFSKFVKQ